VDVAGKIPAELSADTGRALGRLTGLGWGPRLRALLEPGAAGAAPGDPVPGAVPGGAVPGGAVPGKSAVPDDSVPPDLVAALVQVLAAWDWEQRPAGVVTLPSHTRPQLIASLGERIAEIGRLPMLGSLSYAGSGPRAGASAAQQFNSPQRLQAVWRELRLPGPLAEAIASLGGPVLVIDDRIDSGWTMTVAARLLREAGAPRVLPLVLAVNAG
jgi:ATP-dependent DNA helicase RecQ